VSPTAFRRRARTIVPVSGAVLVGMLTVLQARANGQLGVELDDAFAAALVSFGSGLMIVLAVALALPSGRRGLRALRGGIAARDVTWWMLCGGIAGAFNVVAQTLTVAIVGAALFTVGLVAGQTVGGLVMDRIGYSPAGASAVTVRRAAGAALTLVAVLVALGGDTLARVPWWMLVLPVASGACLSWQQATNGRLQVATRSPIAATVVNFAGGTAVLLCAAIAHAAVAGLPEELPSNPLLYAGGALGVVYIALSAAITPRTGVLVFGLGSVLGLLAGSVLLDVLWPAAAPAPLWQAVLTVAFALAGVIVAARRRGVRTRA